jgi:bacteriocin biosynthesis cyclodehydratase domain-containing protein
VRLRAGLDLFDGGAEGWLLQGSDGAFTRVHVASDLMAEAAPVLWGQRAPAAALAAEAAHADLAELLERFDGAGYLEGADAAPAEAHGRVLLLGSGPIADACARLLTCSALTFEPDLAALAGSAQATRDALRVHDVVLACATHLPDTAWLRLDALCAEQGRPWQRCHIEGARALLGPCTQPGLSPGYADVRARRLAAEAYPRARMAHWQAFETQPHARAYEPSAPAVAFVAALLTTDVHALLRGATPPGAQRVTCVALDTLAVEHHRVLPVPTGLMCAAVA